MEPKQPGEKRSLSSTGYRALKSPGQALASPAAQPQCQGSLAAHYPPGYRFSSNWKLTPQALGGELKALGGAGKGADTPGSSRGWPRERRPLEGWLPCSCLRAGGNLRTRGSESPFGHLPPAEGRSHPGLSRPTPDPTGSGQPLGLPGGAEARVCLPSRGGSGTLGPPSPRGRLQPARTGREGQQRRFVRWAAGHRAPESGPTCGWRASSCPGHYPSPPAHPRPSGGRPAVSPAGRRAPAAPAAPFRPLDFIHAPPGPHLGGDPSRPRREITDGGHGGARPQSPSA